MKRGTSQSFQLVACCCLIGCWSVTAGAAGIDFQRDIRPLLSATCFECHGPDESHREGELRLDLQADAFADRGGYAAFVAGDIEASAALQRIISNDPDELMPPADSGKKKLTPEQVEMIRQWIAQGAQWSGHWAFEPPQRAEIPDVQNQSFVRTPIDAFVLARLEREGLEPSEEVDRVTQLRRLSLDLIGLPPTIEQIDAFVDDQLPGAYARQVERLLQSEHYGERWGRIWLDAARYADSSGFEKDKPRSVWFYRDWVIGALNQDLPYDEFIIQQIAGDLLPGAKQDQLVATGFLRNSMQNEEGGIDPEQFRMEAMFDRIDAIGRAVLGITLQCSQCHSHKYDPFSHQDYYRLFAFLNDAHEANIAVYTPDERRQRAEIFDRMEEIQSELKQGMPDWREQMTAWESTVRDDQPEWNVLEIANAGDNGQRYFRQEDGSLLAQGYAPSRLEGKFVARVEQAEIRAFRLELITDPNLPAGGPGRAVDGMCAVTEFKVFASDASNPEQKRWVKFVSATSDFSNEHRQLPPPYEDKEGNRRSIGPASYAVDEDSETAWGIDAGPGRRNQSRKAVFVAEENIAYEEGTQLEFHLVQQHGGWNSNDNQTLALGRFRISATSVADAAADPLPRDVRDILSIPTDERTSQQQAAVFRYWRTTVPQWAEANEQIESLWREHPAGSTQLVYQRRDQLRQTHVLERGDFLNPAEQVEPGVPAFLNPFPEDAEPNRLGFARWLVDRRSPTTARALVNRVWQSYFGAGLVRTPDDLGSQGEPPTHPRLLDWLAVELMEHGWSLKHLHRTIVLSSTYRQRSHVTPALYERDPNNRLLARGPRFRVDAEIVRDIALSASGLLDRTIGGPSVFPPAPEFLFLPPTSYGDKAWNVATGPDRYRRALYTFRFRSVPYPVLQAFDAPSGEISCVSRARSNTPLQALTTLNEPLFMECAVALAKMTVAAACDSDEERIGFAFRRCVAREPAPDETAELLAFLRRQTERFASGEADPCELVGVSGQTSNSEIDPIQLAAWTAVARVMLNLDETITKQ